MSKSIKELLKEYSVTLTDFSGILNITRPTLDSYIKSFDCGRETSNTSINNIFDFLFPKEELSYEEFNERYKYIKVMHAKRNTESQNALQVEYSKSRINNPLQNKIIDILNNNSFSFDTLDEVYKILQRNEKHFILLKEYDEFALYSESIEGKFYLVFKNGSQSFRENSIEINGLFHYVLYSCVDKNDMDQFICDNLIRGEKDD